jgi:hypothetical protein
MSTETNTVTKTKRVKHVFSNMSEVAHIFAHEIGRDVRCRNGFIENGVIYSFGRHFPIAKRYIDDKGKATIFFTLDSYSSTTSKHISDVWRATQHLEKLYMPKVPSYSTPNHDVNIVIWRRNIEECLSKAASARENKAWYVQDARKNVEQLESYIKFFKIKLDKETKAVVTKAKSDKWEQEVEEYKKKKAERLVDPKLSEKQEKARIAREKRELRDNAEQIEKWRNFEAYKPYVQKKRRRYGSNSSQPDLLRYNAEKERIETSQSVQIPIELAYRFYRYIKVVLERGSCIGTETCKYEIAGYTVQEITPQHIRVGCHRITQTEIELMAIKMNWNGKEVL